MIQDEVDLCTFSLHNRSRGRKLAEPGHQKLISMAGYMLVCSDWFVPADFRVKPNISFFLKQVHKFRILLYSFCYICLYYEYWFGMPSNW